MASSGKFDGVDFSQIDIEALTPELRQLGQGFRCVREKFVTYWKQGRIQREANTYLCQCWIVRVGDSLAGYITLLADKLQVEDTLLDQEGVKYRTFPAVKIGLLAVDRRTKGQTSVERPMNHLFKVLPHLLAFQNGLLIFQQL
jgi:hypothetical protein